MDFDYNTGQFVSGKSVYFHSQGVSLDPNTAYFLPIYVKGSTGSQSDVPTDETTGMYVPTDANQFPSSFALTDGDVLDLSKLNSTGFTGNELVISGNVKIIGGGRQVSGLQIKLNGDAHLTLENITFNFGSGESYILGATGSNPQLRIKGNVRFSGTSVMPIFVESESTLSVFGDTATSPRLELASGTASGVFNLNGNMEVQNVALDISNSAGTTITTGSGVVYVNNCATNFSAPSAITGRVNMAFENSSIDGTNVEAVASMYNSTTNLANDYFEMDLHVSNDSQASTIDNIEFYFYGPAINTGADGTDVPSGVYKFPSVDKGKTHSYDSYTYPVFHTAPEYIQFQKPKGINAVKIADITLHLKFQDVQWVSERIYYDDNDVHKIYPASYSVGGRANGAYTVHTYFAERVTDNSAVLAATADELLKLEQLEQTIASLKPGEVVNLPVNLIRDKMPDGSILKALAQSDGKLALEVTDGRDNFVRMTFDSQDVIANLINIQNINLDYTLSEAGGMGIADLLGVDGMEDTFKNAMLLSLDPELFGVLSQSGLSVGNILGLDTIEVFNTADFNFNTGQLFDVYTIVNGVATLHSRDLAVNDIGALKLRLDSTATDFALVPKTNTVPTSPSTGE